MKFLSGLRAGIPLALLLGGIYAGREALSELARRMPDYSRINYKEAYNVLESGTTEQIRHFADKLNTTGVFESGDEIRAFRNASPEGKIQLFVLKGKEIRREQLREKKKNEQFISQEDLKKLKKINPEMYLNDDEREELNELENESFLPKVSVERTNTSGTPGLQEALDKNKLRVGLTDDPFALLETTQEKPVLPYFESSTRVAIETKNLNELMNEKNELIIQMKKELDARKRYEIQTKITELDRKISEVKHNIQRQDKTKPVEAVTRGLNTVDQPAIPTSTATPTVAPTVAPMATPMPAFYEGDEQPTTGPNSFAELDSREPPNENTAYKLPEPSAALVTPTKTKLDRNPYEKDLSNEGLRNFIRQNESIRLKNELMKTAEEYEELARILKGISTQPIKPETTPSPISQMLNNATIANNDLVLRNMFTMDNQVLNNVSNNGRTEVLPDTPMSVEASQRDDTYTLTTVLNRYKKAYV